MRIAVAGLVHETNTFAPFATTLADFSGFDGQGLARGLEVLAKTPPKVSLRGFVDAATAAGHEVVPLLHAHAQPSAHVEEDAFESICSELIEGLRSGGTWDAVFLELHGAMVARHISDADAEILRRVRDVVGSTPIAVTLDSHGNVSEDLVWLADAAVAYRTYPHVDMYQTGERAFRLLEPLMGTVRRHERAWRSLPFLLPINLQNTMAAPCDGLYRQLEALEKELGAGTTLSLCTGFPLADVPQCHASVFGYGWDAIGLQRQIDRLQLALCDEETAFQSRLTNTADAVAQAMQAKEGPVILADVQDNAGGGGTSDTIWVVDALLDAGAPDAVVGLVYDPEAAECAHERGIGSTLRIAVGGKLMPGQRARELDWVVEHLHSGDFALNGPMLDGGRMDLGRMAQLRHAGVRLVVTSRRTWYVEQECFRVCGIQPESHRIVVVKSTNHYRADFTRIASRIIEFGAPAAVAMDPATLDYRHLRDGMRLGGTGPAFRAPASDDALRTARPVLWTNPSRTNCSEPQGRFTQHDVRAAAERFRRFAPALALLFPTLKDSDGSIESPLLQADAMQAALGLPRSFGRLLVKADHLLPVAGSIKARGGVHEVLEFAEKIARRHGLIDGDGDYAKLATPAVRKVFGQYLVAVGSTGNLGLSIGVTAAAFGFRTAVHMSSEAKEWKKARLRALGVSVVEHAGDYQSAVAAGRAQAEADDMTHFVDDERSPSLLLGYASAVPHLLMQLRDMGVTVDPEHPLFVYLPCGVGGAPAGITLGLSLLQDEGVHCFVAEPLQSPCFAIRMLHPGSPATVYDWGLTNHTEADGLAVPQASELAAEVVAPTLAGGFTVADEAMFRLLALAHRSQQQQLEPSAAAGFAGPMMLLRTSAGQQWRSDHGMAPWMHQATHLVWTTGGSFVPPQQFQDFLQRGERTGPVSWWQA